MTALIGQITILINLAHFFLENTYIVFFRKYIIYFSYVISVKVSICTCACYVYGWNL